MKNTDKSHNLLDALEHDGGQLAMMLSQPPIAFHRAFVSLTGSATAALLLSMCVELMNDPAKSDLEGWLLVSSEEMTERCGLSRKEQVTARDCLRDMNILQERRTGFPAQLEMRLKTDQLERALLKLSQSQRLISKSNSSNFIATEAMIFGTVEDSRVHTAGFTPINGSAGAVH
jgi:hypothetical protein